MIYINGFKALSVLLGGPNYFWSIFRRIMAHPGKKLFRPNFLVSLYIRSHFPIRERRAPKHNSFIHSFIPLDYTNTFAQVDISSLSTVR